MITTPTVLVLGAGASQPYQFPSGPALLRAVAADLAADGAGVESPVTRIVKACGNKTGMHSRVRDFQRELLDARRLSIDAFIESRASDYDEIGRCAIAQHTLRLEAHGRLFPPLEEDWYTVLFNAISGNSPENFRRNTLRVITFNFDRSFERALYLALGANFRNPDVVQSLLGVVPVIHVHGDLGLPLWDDRFRHDSEARPYEESQDVSDIATVTSRIRIVHHDISPETRELVHDALTWAKRCG
jgi:hypothetical protein